MFMFRNHVKTLFKHVKRSRDRSSVLRDRWTHTTAVCRCKEEKDPKDEEIAGSISSKYEIFVDYKSPIIFDIEQEREKFYEVTDESEAQRKTVKDFSGISPTRGESGVFEVNELVEILHKENAVDLVVIKIPEEYAYVDYFVIASGRSSRHMRAIAEYIRRVWKFKTNSEGHVPAVEGRNSPDWKALDLGNIALHLMSKSARELYDLESLWSVGSEYDAKCNMADNVEDYSYGAILSKLMPASEVP